MHEGKKENYRMRIRVKDRERKKEKKEKSREKDTEWVGGKDRKAGQTEKKGNEIMVENIKEKRDRERKREK